MKLKLKFDPYVYVRTITKRSKLLNKDDYNKLLKLSLPEIAKYLQDGEYKKEIGELGVHHTGSILLEFALLQNLHSTFDFLRQIMHDDMGILITAYEKRFHIFNLKTIIRGISRGLNKEEIKKMLLVVPNDNKYSKFLEKDNVIDVLKLLELNKSKDFNNLVRDYQENNSLNSVEFALDYEYYNSLFNIAEIIPRQGKVFKSFLYNEIDVLNLLSLLKLKIAGLQNDEIKKQLLPFGKVAHIDTIENLAEKDYEKILLFLSKSRFKKVYEQYKDDLESKNLSGFERGMQKYMLERTRLLSNQNSLTLDAIMSYIFAKTNEVRNLRIIIKGKELGVDEEYIEQQLVV